VWHLLTQNPAFFSFPKSARNKPHMPWYLDAASKAALKARKESGKESGSSSAGEKKMKMKKMKKDGEEEKRAQRSGKDAAGDDGTAEEKKKNNKKKKWKKNKVKRKQSEREEGEEKPAMSSKEKRKKLLDESKALLANAPSVSANWQKLLARGDIKTSEKGKHRKHDFEPASTTRDSRDGRGDNDENSNENGEFRRPMPTSRDASVTEVLAMDCEMVGVGEDGTRSVLARVTVVNEHGNVVLDTFVESTEKVTDYRTKVSGVRPRDLKNAPKFADVQKMVSKLIEKKIVVGHGLKNDFKALLLHHPRERTRDTALYHPLTRPLRSHERCVEGAPRGRGSRSLKELTRTHLRMTIQEGEHSSAEDARAALFLYAKFKKKWEQSLLVAMKKRH